MWFHLCAFDQGRTRHNRYAVNATERRMTFVSFFPGAALGKVLAWSKAVSLSQVGFFFSSNFFAAETCKLLWHWKANWAKDGSTGGLVATVGAGSGPQDQAHSDTHHAAGTLSSLFEPLLCSAFFFSFSFNLIDFKWLSTRATLKEPTGGCGLAKAYRPRASYCWFSGPVQCFGCCSPLCWLWSPVSWVLAGGDTDVELNQWYWSNWWLSLLVKLWRSCFQL